MEQYTDKQREIFQKFYEECRAKKIDPTKSEVNKQKALLLAKENKKLFRLLGDRLDGGHVDAYRMGKEYAEAKAAATAAEEKAAAEAEAEAKIAEKRKIDEQMATLERELSTKRGREKRLFFYSKSVEEAQKEVREATESENSAAQMWAGMNALEQQKESSWGTLGGIAAGITGSTAVGAAVAADTMRKNAEIRARNEAISQKNFELTMSLGESARRGKYAALNKLRQIEAEAEKVKLHLTEERPLEELMDGLSCGTPQIAFTEGNTMLVQMEVGSQAGHRISDLPAVVDGCFIAEVYEDTKKIGEAYLNFPRDGIDRKKILLSGYCLEAKPGGDYTVLILPLALWLIEKYTPSPIHYSVGYGSERKEIDYHIADLDQLFPVRKSEFSWKTVKLSSITWRQRLEQKQLEDEQKRKAEKEQARKNKTIAMIAVPIAVVAIVAGVLISNAMQRQQAEAERLESYNTGLALLESGEYNEAEAIFEELGDYQDSAAILEDIPNQRTYAMAMRYMDSGDYKRAADLFAQLGNYQDSKEQAGIAGALALEEHNEELYSEALELYSPEDGVTLDTLNESLAIFNQISPDYKDTSKYLEEISAAVAAIELLNGTYDGEPYYMDLYNKTYNPVFTIDGANGKGTRWLASYDYQGKIYWYIENGQVTRGYAKLTRTDGRVSQTWDIVLGDPGIILVEWGESYKTFTKR